MKDPKWMEHAAAKMKKKGTVGMFSKQAKKAGMTNLEYAKKVMKSGSKASALTKKRANFARNASKAK